jgi:hypothetical protein
MRRERIRQLQVGAAQARAHSEAAVPGAAVSGNCTASSVVQPGSWYEHAGQGAGGWHLMPLRNPGWVNHARCGHCGSGPAGPLPGFAGSGRSYPQVLRDTAAARAGWQGGDRAAADGGAARPQLSGPPGPGASHARPLAGQEPAGSCRGRYRTDPPATQQMHCPGRAQPTQHCEPAPPTTCAHCLRESPCRT